MRKSIFIALMAMTMLLSAEAYSQASFGVKGSFNMFNITGENASGDKFENKMLPTFDAGVFAEFPIAPEFVIRPELLYAAKGTKTDDFLDDAKLKLSYIELPVLFLYKGALQGNSVLLGFGPYFAMGVGGQAESGNVQMDVKFKGDVSPADLLQAFYLKPFDFGARMMAGYEFSGGFSIALNASMGLSDLEPKLSGETSDAVLKNTGFGLSLGYRFGKN